MPTYSTLGCSAAAKSAEPKDGEQKGDIDPKCASIAGSGILGKLASSNRNNPTNERDFKISLSRSIH